MFSWTLQKINFKLRGSGGGPCLWSLRSWVWFPMSHKRFFSATISVTLSLSVCLSCLYNLPSLDIHILVLKMPSRSLGRYKCDLFKQRGLSISFIWGSQFDSRRPKLFFKNEKKIFRPGPPEFTEELHMRQETDGVLLESYLVRFYSCKLVTAAFWLFNVLGVVQLPSLDFYIV